MGISAHHKTQSILMRISGILSNEDRLCPFSPHKANPSSLMLAPQARWKSSKAIKRKADAYAQDRMRRRRRTRRGKRCFAVRLGNTVSI
jgi:hypothetical protein